jgi:endonuclease/exonuclease/phosphatase family metal-dependent hydrolase
MAGVVVATWNVENFSSKADNFDEKLQYLKKALEGINPDVVALQEVLDEDAGQALADALGLEFRSGEPDGRGIRVAYLTRAAPSNVEVLSEWRLPAGVIVQELDAQGKIATSIKPNRPGLKITVRHDGKDIDFINVHLKSKLLTFPGGAFSTKDESLRARVAYFALQRRAAEATTIREHVTDLLKGGRNVVVLGDLNDVPQAATTEILYGPDGSQARGTADAANPNSGFNREDAAEPQRLFNLALTIDEAGRWSRRYAGQNELIDHILTSASLMKPRTGGKFAVPVVEILNADAPMRDDTPVTNGVKPDHAPVIARFS